jgi:hypothetical protein
VRLATLWPKSVITFFEVASFGVQNVRVNFDLTALIETRSSFSREVNISSSSNEKYHTQSVTHKSIDFLVAIRGSIRCNIRWEAEVLVSGGRSWVAVALGTAKVEKSSWRK